MELATTGLGGKQSKSQTPSPPEGVPQDQQHGSEEKNTQNSKQNCENIFSLLINLQ